MVRTVMTIISSIAPQTSDPSLDRLLNPARFFGHPEDVLRDSTLDVQRKARHPIVMGIEFLCRAIHACIAQAAWRDRTGYHLTPSWMPCSGSTTFAQVPVRRCLPVPLKLSPAFIWRWTIWMSRLSVPTPRQRGLLGAGVAVWTAPTTFLGHAIARFFGCSKAERIDAAGASAWLYRLPRSVQGFRGHRHWPRHHLGTRVS